MEDMLRINYNLINSLITADKKKIFIKNNGINYILQNVSNISTLEIIYKVIKEQKITNQFYEIILNNRNHMVTSYKNKMYCLLKINNNIFREQEDINLYKINNYKEYNKYTINWISCWERKCDLLTNTLYQSSCSLEIKEVADYYLGLTEIAIQYLKNTNYQKEYGSKELYISRRRQDKENNRNPLDLVIDRKERNLAEKIKNDFFYKTNTKYTIEKIQQLIETEELDKNIVIARLIFPTYFYDIIDKYIDEENIENDIKNITKKSLEYETMLKQLFDNKKTR